MGPAQGKGRLTGRGRGWKPAGGPSWRPLTGGDPERKILRRLRFRPSPTLVPGFLDRSRTIAPPGYNRWRVPPAALAIHQSIGQSDSISVFNHPLATLIGGDMPAQGDWKLSTIGWIFSVAIVFLGLSAFTFGRWLEDAGPRKAMFASALCFSTGFLVSALGVATHQIWLLYLGYGVIGGIGLGLGYISPVSTLIKWFPDRPGMATGLAIMGFGGGAMIGSPLAVALMNHYRTPASPGVAQAMVAMGLLYLAFMMFGVLTVRLPAPGWTPPARAAGARVTHAARDMHVNDAVKTPTFWFLWGVLCLNVTAGIGVLGQASPMIQEMFPARIGPEAAAGFVGLLSLANMAGRFVWSSFSDVLGRPRTYMIYFALGAVLYALVPSTGRAGNVVFFVAFYAVIMSMYGGGFATIPAYLRDRFGVMHVGAIHGRLLTAWSLAGVAGPALVNYIREYQIGRGVPRADAYSFTMYLMAALLVVGFSCNWAASRRPFEGKAA
ncbi:MAG: OFA family MFS transporter [Cytophagaceae bacterium]|nr:OFA family MFS transporter [Gemmatimonadaceae bacterium]